MTAANPEASGPSAEDRQATARLPLPKATPASFDRHIGTQQMQPCDGLAWMPAAGLNARLTILNDI
jgi:hypothetical protein